MLVHQFPLLTVLVTALLASEQHELSKVAETQKHSTPPTDAETTWRVDVQSSHVYVKVAAQGLGHSHAVTGSLRPSSRLTLRTPKETVGQDVERAKLLKDVDALEKYIENLSDATTWKRYLQIAELKRLVGSSPEKLEASSRAKLYFIATTFDKIDRDPQYRGVSGQVGFQNTHVALQRFLAPGAWLVFDMASFDADEPNARRHVNVTGQLSGSDRSKVNETMRGPEVLDVNRFPDAAYAVRSVQPLDSQEPGKPGRYQLDGFFTLHALSRPLKIVTTVDHEKTGDSLRMRGQFSILQTDYGIKPYSALLGTVAVADRLEIWGDLVLVHASDKESKP